MNQPILVLAVALLALAGPWPAQEPPGTGIRSGTWITRIGVREIARESFTLRPDGYEAEGRFDVMGMQKGAWALDADRDEAGHRRFRIEDRSKEGGGEALLRFEGDTVVLVARTEGGEIRREKPLPAKRPFPFLNLAWICIADLTRQIAQEPSPPGPDPEFATGVLHASRENLKIALRGTRRVAWTRAGVPWVLVVYELGLGPVDMTVVCSPGGVPLRIDVPAQKLSVVLEGFEGVPAPVRAPHTIVDSGPWREKLSSPDHEVITERGLRVAMRDGVELACDVFRPDGEGPFPAILARTPYNRVTEGDLRGPDFAARGYVFVAQDVRGRFDSGGDWFPCVHEEADGSDTLDWIAAQPWSDGQVGMIGASYVGWVQWFAARSGNPHLKCIVPLVAPPDPDQNIPYEGGVFSLAAAWWARVASDMAGGDRGRPNWLEAFATLPLGELDRALGVEGSFLDAWLSHPPHDREFWDPQCYQHLFPEFDLPALHVTGWYDGDQPGAIQGFEGMRRGARTEAARRAQRLVIGPWTHAFNTSRRIGGVDFGEDAVVDLDSLILRFLDRHLKGIRNGVDEEDPVLVFVMGRNRWRREADWPVPGTVETALFLSGGDCRLRTGDGRLGLAPPGEDAPPASFVYDPLDLPPTSVDFDSMDAHLGPRAEQPDREDCLDYTSPPLQEDCELLGSIRLELHASTDAADTDFAFTLLVLEPDGRVAPMAGGIQRLRYHAGARRDTPVPPGTVVRLEVDGWAKGWLLRKGQRLRLEVHSTLWPGYARNLNTLEPILTAARAVKATNTVHHAPPRPSRLLLPVVPRPDAPGLLFEAPEER
jgi:putative CocE/NonD family hydrolase